MGEGSLIDCLQQKKTPRNSIRDVHHLGLRTANIPTIAPISITRLRTRSQIGVSPDIAADLLLYSVNALPIFLLDFLDSLCSNPSDVSYPDFSGLSEDASEVL